MEGRKAAIGRMEEKGENEKTKDHLEEDEETKNGGSSALTL